MGGMIAQHLAAEAPQRVASLTLMMTTSGARSLPQPPWRVRKVLMSRPMKPGADAAVDWILHVLRVIGSPGYPMSADAMRERAQASVQRAWHPAGSARQLLAVVADGDRTPLLSRITAPTRIVHGIADPLVPVACGHHLAEHIAGAQTDFIPGMGHDLPEALLPRLAQGIVETASRAPAPDRVPAAAALLRHALLEVTGLDHLGKHVVHGLGQRSVAHAQGALAFSPLSARQAWSTLSETNLRVRPFLTWGAASQTSHFGSARRGSG